MSAYDAGAWHDFFVTAGTGAAALTGLLFVALSIQLDRILGHPEHRFRARGNFFGLTLVMVMALVVLMPSLNARWLGLGLIVPNLTAAAVNAWHIRGVLPTMFRGSIVFPLRVALSYVLILMGIAGGISVMVDAGVAWCGPRSSRSACCSSHCLVPGRFSSASRSVPATQARSSTARPVEQARPHGCAA